MEGVEQRLDELRNEVIRLRDRCHALESDRATVRVLQRAVTELESQLPNLARQAAREAVSEDRRRRHADLFGNLRTYAAIASAGIALGALIVALLLR